MSSSTHSAVVPFKYVERNWNNPILSKIVAATEKQELDKLGSWKYEDYFEYVDQNKNRLYCDVAEKEKFKVYIVNEAFYSNGGEYQVCAFAENIESLLEFCAEFGLNKEWITTNNVVQQTL